MNPESNKASSIAVLALCESEVHFTEFLSDFFIPLSSSFTKPEPLKGIIKTIYSALIPERSVLSVVKLLNWSYIHYNPEG